MISKTKGTTNLTNGSREEPANKEFFAPIILIRSICQIRGAFTLSLFETCPGLFLVETIPETGSSRVSVALIDKEMARDMVEAITRNLIGHLVKADERRTGKAVGSFDIMIIEASDVAEEKQKDLANRLSIYGAGSSDAGEAALADGEVKELQFARTTSSRAAS